MNVVLVHGFLDSARIMSGLYRHLSTAGHTCLAPTLKPSDARSGIPNLAEQLARCIDASLPIETPFALVGFSMGTLVCRHYLQVLGGSHRVRAFFSIAGPHSGTLAAMLYPGQGARDMRPQSGFLRHLAATVATLGRLPIVCYWSPTDPVIVPTRSARMSGAEHVRLLLTFHPLLPFDPRIYRDIERRLSLL